MDLNLRQWRWLELLKEYDINVLYQPGEANVVADALSCLSMGSLFHVEESKRNLVKDVCRLACLGIWIEDSSIGGAVVQHNSESSLVVDLNSKQHLDHPLIELKESIFGKLNE